MTSPSAILCPVCGSIAARTSLFCPHCTAPLAVVALAELTHEDRQRCLAALTEVLSTSIAAPRGAAAVRSPNDANDAQLFSAYLSALWLRPETALIQFAEARGLNQLELPPGPWLDLGCGDGIHAAIYSGWRFAPDFDAFQSLDLTARDLFDHFDAAHFSASIAVRGRTVDVGLDIKSTAVARSKALGVFARVEPADATRLPLADGSMAVVFSNMLRDLDATLPAALREVARVLQPDGRLVLSAMTPAYRDSLYFEPLAHEADRDGRRADAEQLLRLDRGRGTFCRQQLSVDDWESLLAQHGLGLVHVEPIVGPEPIRFWDVGLRPFSIALIAQAQAWRARGLLGEVKPPLVAILASLLESLRRRIAVGTTCMHLLVARRRE